MCLLPNTIQYNGFLQMGTQLNMKLQMYYLQKGNWTHLLNCWCANNLPCKVFQVQCWKKCPNYFHVTTSDYLSTHYSSMYSMVKCCQNVRSILSFNRKKWWILITVMFKHDTLNKILLWQWKANFYSVDNCRLIKSQ